MSFSRTHVIVGQGEFRNCHPAKEQSKNTRQVSVRFLRELESMMLQFVLNLHFYNMILVLATSTISAIWGFILFFVTKAITRSWRISLIITTIVGVLQALLGITLVLMGQKPGGGNLYYLHYVYGGIVALGFVVAITFTTSGKNPRRDVLVYSLAALAIAAAGVRAMMTGLGLP